MKTPRDIWHEGEQHMHQAFGIKEKMQARGEIVVRDFMPDQHRQFFEMLPFVAFSALDAEGRVWPFIRSGGPGFIASPTPTELVVRSTSLPGESETLLLDAGAKISLVGIELETRRRNRLNGTITERSNDILKIAVDQSFGNCPRYIRPRGLTAGPIPPLGDYSTHTSLRSNHINQIGRSESLYIASRSRIISPDRRAGVDVNHRGGEAGFVTVLNETELVIPDYDGNKFFNTFGNILRDPRCGILFPDYQTGALLTLNGIAEIVMHDSDGHHRFGAARYLRFHTESVRCAPCAFPLRYRPQPK